MMLPPDLPPRLLLLFYIDKAEQAPKAEKRNPTRYGIIAELCEEFCAPKLAELKSSFRQNADPNSLVPAELRSKITARTKEWMRTLEKEFLALAQEMPEKIIWDPRGGAVKLSEEGRNLLKDATKPKSDPAQ